MVATLFIDNPNGYKEVNHINGIKSDNSKNNLEWCDRTYNEHECRRNRLKEYKPFVVYFENGDIKQYEFAIELANELNVTKRCVQNYLKNISNGYKNKGIKIIEYI